MAAVAFATEVTESDSQRDRLLEIIKEQSLLKDGNFVLSSGRKSNYYFVMKKTSMHPEGSNLVASLILKQLENMDVDAIGGIAMGAVPIVSVVCARSFYSDRHVTGFFVRKEAKQHGTKELVDGHIETGMKVIVVDDVTTSGESVLKAVNAAREAGCIVNTVITVVDREEGAVENLKMADITLCPLFTSSDFD